MLLPATHLTYHMLEPVHALVVLFTEQPIRFVDRHRHHVLLLEFDNGKIVGRFDVLQFKLYFIPMKRGFVPIGGVA